jgi:glycosyltransferase involved in cell wall biosynthesis
MRVVLVTRDLPPARPGGVASWVDDVARCLVAAGHEVDVFCESRSVLPDPSRPYCVVPVRGRSWRRWQGVWMAGAVVPRLRTDTVVLGATWPLVQTLARLRVRVPIVVGAHGSDLTRAAPGSPAFSRLAPQLTVLAVSGYLAQRARELGVPHHRVFDSPWPLLPVSGATRDRHLVLAARLIAGKGLRDAVVLAHRLDRRLVVVGDGPERADGEALARQLGADVVWTGALDRPSTRAVLASAAAVLVLSEPGSREGLGLTALEAAAAGVPAIGRAVGGVAEAVGPGWLLPPDACIDTMELDHLQAFLDDSTVGEKAKSFLEARHGPVAFLNTFAAAVDRARTR